MHATCRPQFPKKLPCKLAFIGEAPGDTEMRDGWPLIGPSGRVYDYALRAADIDRREVLTTNVFNIQAPDNDVTAWTVSLTEARAKGWPTKYDFHGRYFDPGFLREHLDRLADELDKARPTVVVPMGATPLWALTHSASITEARGAVDQATALIPGQKILPTFHPAYIIRQWKFFTTIVADMVKAAAEAERGPKIIRQRMEIWTEPTLKDLDAFAAKYLDKCEELSVDIETVRRPSRQITCIGFAPDAARCLVIPFVDWRKPSRSYWPTMDAEMRAWAFVEKWCLSPQPKVLQNGPYDAYWLWELMGIPLRNYSEDTRLMHHALYAELPKDLGFMGATYLSLPPWKTWRAGKAHKKDE
jgi:DNA polymerase